MQQKPHLSRFLLLVAAFKIAKLDDLIYYSLSLNNVRMQAPCWRFNTIVSCYNA